MRVTSDASADQLRVGADSNAARVELRDSEGLELNQPVVGAYILPVNFRMTGTLGAGWVWAMRLGTSATVNVYIRRVFLRSGFDGTAAVDADTWDIRKFSGATHTGGNQLFPIKMHASYPASQLIEGRQTLGSALLTATGVSGGEPIAGGIQPSQLSPNGFVDYNLSMKDDPRLMLKLDPGEGIGMRVTNSLIGEVISGYFQWEER